MSQIQFLGLEGIEVKSFRHKQSESNFKYISHLSLPSIRFQLQYITSPIENVLTLHYAAIPI